MLLWHLWQSVQLYPMTSSFTDVGHLMSPVLSQANNLITCVPRLKYVQLGEIEHLFLQF